MRNLQAIHWLWFIASSTDNPHKLLSHLKLVLRMCEFQLRVAAYSTSVADHDQVQWVSRSSYFEKGSDELYRRSYRYNPSTSRNYGDNSRNRSVNIGQLPELGQVAVVVFKVSLWKCRSTNSSDAECASAGEVQVYVQPSAVLFSPQRLSRLWRCCCFCRCTNLLATRLLHETVFALLCVHCTPSVRSSIPPRLVSEERECYTILVDRLTFCCCPFLTPYL